MRPRVANRGSSRRGGVLSGYNTESMSVDNSGKHVWVVDSIDPSLSSFLCSFHISLNMFSP